MRDLLETSRSHPAHMRPLRAVGCKNGRRGEGNPPGSVAVLRLAETLMGRAIPPPNMAVQSSEFIGARKEANRLGQPYTPLPESTATTVARGKTHAHATHKTQSTTPTRASLSQTSKLGSARGPLRRLPLGPGRYPGARHRPKSRGGTSVLKRRGRGNAQYVCPSSGEGRRAGATARAWLGAHRSSVAG